MRTIRKVELIQPSAVSLQKQITIRRVAVYARVSTSSEEQLKSVEAQKDYYTKLISARDDWEFYALYCDEGISGTSHKHRDGFNRMIADAENRKFDLIITKSISRFARNTVDSLVCIRRLKEIGTEVYFEKEDLWTFDSKGEFMLTLLSSMAQDESRSISENVAWGIRKRFADGQYSVPFKRFLGYDRGQTGELVVNKPQAETIRMIFRLFFEGKTVSAIAEILNDARIPTPAGKKRWWSTVVKSIISNEKYKGDALLQKRFTVDYLTKKAKRNTGELPQYYVTGGHEAIIPGDTFDYAQQLLKQRQSRFGKHYSCTNTLPAKVVCGKCGSLYGIISAHPEPCRHFYWCCHNKYGKETPCIDSPRIKIEHMQKTCQTAIIKEINKRAEIISITRKVLAPCIHPLKAHGKKRDRLFTISTFLNDLTEGSLSDVYLPESVLAVIITEILIMPEHFAILTFLDGSDYKAAFPVPCRSREETPAARCDKPYH